MIYSVCDETEQVGTEDDLLLAKAREMSRADIPEPIQRKILADRMTKSKTGVKVKSMDLHLMICTTLVLCHLGCS
jgi:hypothetical protein